MCARRFGVLVFYSPLIALYCIDYDEMSETTFRLLMLPSLLASSIFERIERREYERIREEQAKTRGRPGERPLVVRSS
jgi:hypothetical protein